MSWMSPIWERVCQMGEYMHTTACLTNIFPFGHNSFKKRDGSNRYTHVKIISGKDYFIDTIIPGGDNLYTADQIRRMLEFLIDNIFVKCGGYLFRQVSGIPVATNCAPC